MPDPADPPEREPAEGTSPSGHYFDAQPVTVSAPGAVRLVLPDVSLDLVTDRGVFAGDRVDTGTKFLLLDGPAVPTGAQHLLDLGCGYGPIAVTLGLRAAKARVWAVDVNERAAGLCRQNAERAGAGNVDVSVIADDAPFGAVPDDVRFDAIWSNPPIRIGKPALHALLLHWLPRLTPDGHAHLVVQKHLGSDSLQRWLADQGWRAERRASRAGYRILDVTRDEA